MAYVSQIIDRIGDQAPKHGGIDLQKNCNVSGGGDVLDRIADELLEDPDGLLVRPRNNILSCKNIYAFHLKPYPSLLDRLYFGLAERTVIGRSHWFPPIKRRLPSNVLIVSRQ